MEPLRLSIFKNARMAKDRNFDGVFYFAVTTTGIFCRPSCSCSIAKEENVLYFNSVYDALDNGFRPCHRCRPDLVRSGTKGFITGAEKVNDALQLIHSGFMNYHTLPELASELFLSERHLRKLFVDNLALSPVKIARYHKAIFAKRLLLYSNLKICDVAHASGFGSIRQFNDTFRSIFDITPSRLRKNNHIPLKSNTVFLLNYNKPFHFNQLLDFMRMRVIKGIEIVTDNEYTRTFRTAGASGYFTVSDDSENSALILTIVTDDVRCYMEIYYKVRSMFDLDTDFSKIRALFSDDVLLKKGMIEGDVPSMPIAFNTFEFAVRAVLGQQVSVKAATTLAERIAFLAGIEIPGDYPQGLDLFFPTARELEKVDFSTVGIIPTRYQTLRNMITGLLAGDISLSVHQPFDRFRADFSTIKGIGDWTVNYVAMRGLGMMDAFPASDLGIIKALTVEGRKPTIREIEKIAEKWKPYRAYAALCLWNIAHDKEN